MNSRVEVYVLIVLALSLLFGSMATADESDLVWSTFLGGSGTEGSDGRIAVDGAGSAYVIATTLSADFPTTAGAFDITLGGGSDAFVAKLNPTGSNLVYSTFLGGGNSDYGYGIEIDDAGNAYVTGLTDSYDFPITPEAFDTSLNDTIVPPSFDAFVTKLNPLGNDLVYSTYLGGWEEDDAGLDIAVEGSGNAYVTGGTWCADFPVTAGSFDVTYNGLYDAFVVKLNSTGSDLVYGTFLGGSEQDQSFSITVDGSGNAYITGDSQSSDFPTTTGAFDSTYNGGSLYNGDVFVTKLSASGDALHYSTYLGGGGGDAGSDIAVDGAGYACVIGKTGSPGFPATAGAFDPTYNGDEDGFVLKLSPNGDVLDFSTFLGGSQLEGAWGLALDGDGNIYFAGQTESADFPTTSGAFDVTYNGVSDVFMGKLDPTGSMLVYSTFMGGSNFDYGSWAVALDDSNKIYIFGGTYSADFPTSVGAFDTTFNGGEDSFVAKFDLSGYPVPVVLANFEASGDQGCIALNWTTASEVNCHKWEIHRGDRERGQYDKIGELPGRGSTETVHTYRWVDRDLSPDVTYYYKLKQIDLDGSSWWSDIVSATASSAVPKSYALHQNYPNPFNASTTIHYQIPEGDHVTLKIFNSLGQEVRDLVDADQKTGRHAVVWDGRDDQGQEVGSGIYFCKLKAGDFGKTIKMVLLK